MNNYQFPKIAFCLLDKDILSGVVTWTNKMVDYLLDQNIDVTLINHVCAALKVSENQIPSSLSNVPILDVKGPYTLYTSLSNQVIEYVSIYEKFLPAVFISNFGSGTYGICAKVSENHSENMRIIGYAHSDELDYYEWLTYYESIIHTFVAVSDEIADNLKKLLPHRQDDILTRPYFVDVHPSLEREYSPQDKPIVITYAGRLVRIQKRILDLVDLAKILSDKKVNFVLKIFGNGSEETELRERIAKLPLSIQKSISLEGRVDYEKMYDIWKSSDICVLVSEYEGTSVSMLEAMANGCVPVVTKVSGTAKVIQPDYNGYVAEVGDLETMATTIAQLAKNRSQLKTIGSNAYQTIINNYSPESYLEWFRKTVEKTWQKHPRKWDKKRSLINPREEELFILRQELEGMKRSIFGKMRIKYIAFKKLLGLIKD